MPSFFATTSRGMEPLLAAELRRFAASVEERRGGVTFTGPLEAGYRACLWSRTASRVLLPLATFAVADDNALYDGVRSVRWSEHLGPGRTLAVDFVGTHARITHSRFGAQRVKDAIVDQLRDERGSRPSVDPDSPDVRINLHIEDGADAERATATVAIDLAGESLHRRGWRTETSLAPLKENLAAAILLLAGWPELAAAGVPLLDPMCGSGTLPIEAALIACGRAPGMGRSRFGFLGWAGHQPELWRRLVEEARDLEVRDPSALPTIVGSDEDDRAVRAARDNVKRAGLAGLVRIERRRLEDCAPPESIERPDGAEPSEGERPRGLLVVNPPYGERLGDEKDLAPLYERIGDVLRRRFPGWRGAVFTGSVPLSRAIGLRPSERHVLWNGPIECRLLILPISAAPVIAEAPAWQLARTRPSPGAEGFKNRVAKNLKHLRKWARREGVSCFRVYDADLPEYAFAVDLYEDAAHVQEYQPPRTVDEAAAEVRRRDARLVLPEALGIQPDLLFEKTRRRGRGGEQYGRQADEGHFRVVHEGGHRFRVNLSDYLDTGLFLDHRRVRALIGTEAAGRDFLNLFCYTATATVYAAAGGARSTTSVDLSRTYLDWARDNLRENGLETGASHRLLHEDVLRWLPEARGRFGLIFIAPPTFSNSRRMEESFDVQRDHAALLSQAARLLDDDGAIVFSAPLRRFKLDEAVLEELAVEDLSAATLAPDFARAARDHHVFRLRRRSS